MNLKLTRIKAGLTQAGLSKASGVCRLTISQLENDNIDGVSVRILKKLASALNTTVTELFFSEEE